MQVLERTIQERRARVACESLLSIGSGQSVSVNNPNLNVSLADYTVSLVVEGSGTISKGGWSVTLNNASRLLHIVYTPSDTWANNMRAGGATNPAWDDTADLVIGEGLKVQHLKIANRSWTDEEMRADHRQPGYAPDSTHESILAHYVADREGLTMWDVMEQYNWAKPTPDNNWGKWARKLGVISGDFTLDVNWVRVGSSSSSADDFGFILHSEALNGEILNFTSEYDLALNSRADSVATINSQHFSSANIATGGANPAIGQIGYSLTIERIGTTINLYENGNLIASRTATSEDYYFYNTPRGTSDNVAEFLLNNQKITEYDQFNGTAVNEAGDVYKTNALQAYHADLINFTPQQVDTAGGTNSAYLDFYNKTILRPFVDTNQDGTPDQPLIEKSSLLPPLVNALDLKGSLNIDMPAGMVNVGGEDFSAVVFLKWNFPLPATAFTRPVSIAGGELQVYFLANSQMRFLSSGAVGTVGKPSEAPLTMLYITRPSDPSTPGQLVTNLHRTNITQSNQTRSVSSDPNDRILISNCWFGGLLVFRRLLSQGELIELYNNSLFSLPKSSYQHDRAADRLEIALFPNTFTLNGQGNYEIPNYGEAGGSAVVSNLTAANLDPQDPAYALTPINDLR